MKKVFCFLLAVGVFMCDCLKVSAEDGLELLEYGVYQYEEDEYPLSVKGKYPYDRWFPQYGKAEIAETNVHCEFDRQGRLTYNLGFSNIDNASYCEETIRQWTRDGLSLRELYYKANNVPYMDISYVTNRYLFNFSDYTLSKDNKVLSMLTYSRTAGDSPYGYSYDLPFDRGYWAEYDGERLRWELSFYLYWNYPDGVWDYNVYKYDDTGKCDGMVSVTGTGNWSDRNIKFAKYSYDEEKKALEYSNYIVKADYEFVCEDGSKYVFYPKAMSGTGDVAVEKYAEDGTKEFELRSGCAPAISPEMKKDMESVFIPEDIDKTVKNHYYTVKHGDCLSQIARDYYKDSKYAALIYKENIFDIGPHMDFILTGMRLYLPELITSHETKIKVVK